MKKTTILKLIISAAFIAFICIKVDWSRFAGMFGQINPLYFILALLMSPLMVLESSFKWQMMLRAQGARVPFVTLLKNYTIGYFFSVMLPSNVGGDVVRSYYVGRHIGDQYTSAVAVFIERFSGVMLLLLLAVVTPFIKPALLREWAVIIPMIASALLILTFTATVASERLIAILNSMINGVFGVARRINTALHLKVLNSLVDKLAGFYARLFEKGMKFHRKLRKSFAFFREKPVYLFWMVFLSILFYAMTWLNVYVAFRAFNVHPRFIDVIALLPIIMLVSMMPITIGSIGLAEGAYVYYFMQTGIARESSFVMSLLMRFKLMLLASVGFLVYLTYSHRKEDFRRIVSASEQEKPEV